MNRILNLSSIIDPTSPVLISLPVVFTIFKILFLILFTLYAIYALVIVRQIALMARTVSTNFQGLLKILAFLHLILSILILVFAFMA